MTSLVVVGDVMLDVDLVGTATRLAPDAAVPVLTDLTERTRPGGAALAATLAAAHPDALVTLVAPVPDDASGRELCRLLPERVTLIGLECDGSTAVKTRLRAGRQSVARLDRGSERNRVRTVPDAVRPALAGADAVLVADYGRGCTDAEPIRALLSEAAHLRPLVWDPHPRGREPVLGTLLSTPNATELAGFLGQPPSAALDALTAQARRLRAQWQLPWLVTTLGERGALLQGGDGPYLVAAEAAPGDPCGAGDAFAAALTLALSRGALPSEAVEQAVAAAGNYVRSGAAIPVTSAGPAAGPAEPVAGESLEALLSRVRGAGGTVVATGGCFDLLHPGHVAVLAAARAWGDCLVVCLNSDRSVRRLKGDDRPVQNQDDRAAVLSALRWVDAVVIFDEDTPERALSRIRPDLWVKGGDYAGLELPEAAVLAEWGGVTATVPYQPGRSTTALVRRARAN